MRNLVFILSFLIAGNIFSQDIHFSQFYNALLTVNPALTGAGAKPLRLGLIYRNQGRTIPVPYKTYTAFIDGRFSFKKVNRTWFGAGLSAYNDHAGDGILSNTFAALSFSVTRGFNRYNTFLVSMGFSAGLLNRSVQFSNLVFDDQWNGVKFDPSLGSNEPFVSQSVFAPDINFGVLISYLFNSDVKMEAGTALHHINKPKTSFYDADNRIDWKLLTHARMEITLDNKSRFVPAVFYSVQASTQELVFGGNLYYGSSDFELIGGLWYRWARDVIPGVGINYRNYNFMLTYDVNISALHGASNYLGGIEISLVKVFRKKTSRYPCSEFK